MQNSYLLSLFYVCAEARAEIFWSFYWIARWKLHMLQLWHQFSKFCLYYVKCSVYTCIGQTQIRIQFSGHVSALKIVPITLKARNTFLTFCALQMNCRKFEILHFQHDEANDKKSTCSPAPKANKKFERPQDIEFVMFWTTCMYTHISRNLMCRARSGVSR